MTMLCASIDRAKVREVDEWSAKLGRPYNFQRLIDTIDFDPDEVMAHIDQLLTAHDTLAQSAPTLDAAKETVGVWAGDAARKMQESGECQRSFWDQVLDFLLWLAETLTKMTGSDLERQAADVTARVSEFKSQIEARQQAIRERRNRLGL